MNQDELQQLLEMNRMDRVSMPQFMDQQLVLFLLAVILGITLFVLIARRILQSRPKLVSDRCHTCGGPMKRVHQLWWLRFVAPVLPFWTLYCKACAIKSVRVKPRVVRRKKRRSRREEQ